MAQLQSHSTNAEELLKVKNSLESLPRMCGRVRKVRSDKGFGFIAGDDGNDYFFHWSSVKKQSTKELREFAVRDRVEFCPIRPEKGNRAIEVIYIPDE